MLVAHTHPWFPCLLAVLLTSCKPQPNIITIAPDTSEAQADADTGCDDDDCDDDTDADTDSNDDTAAITDADGDGYGEDSDCDDTSSAVHPGADEVCDELDNDCDGYTDEGVQATWYADLDGDGYGDSADYAKACDQPSGYVEDDTDCNDGSTAANPGEAEVCGDGIDNDCDDSEDCDDSDCDEDLDCRLAECEDASTSLSYSGVLSYSTTEGGVNMGSVEGAGEVCTVVCDDWFAVPWLSTVGSCVDELSPPVEISDYDDVVVCIDIADPGTPTWTSCDVEWGDGGVTLQVRGG